MSRVNIFNGSLSKELAEELEMEGVLIAWNEMLCTGKTIYDVSSNKFWESRIELVKSLGVGDEESYGKLVIEEFSKVYDVTNEEIVLWFEYDLFCQINMIALISFFTKTMPKNTLSLVCIGDHPDFEHRLGLCEIPKEEFKTLYNRKIVLSDSDKEFADLAWKYYCEDMVSFDALRVVPESFEYFGDTISANRLRFPLEGKNLSAIELAMLELVNSGKYSREELILELLKRDKVLGYGDFQYEIVFRRLVSLFEESNDAKLALTTEGLLVLEGKPFEESYLVKYIGGESIEEIYYSSNASRISKNMDS